VAGSREPAAAARAAIEIGLPFSDRLAVQLDAANSEGLDGSIVNSNIDLGVGLCPPVPVRKHTIRSTWRI